MAVNCSSRFLSISQIKFIHFPNACNYHHNKLSSNANTAPHSPRRHKLNLRMKSLSLDSPESSELHSHMRRRYPPSGPVHFVQSGSAGLLDHNTSPSNNSRLHCKC